MPSSDTSVHFHPATGVLSYSTLMVRDENFTFLGIRLLLIHSSSVSEHSVAGDFIFRVSLPLLAL